MWVHSWLRRAGVRRWPADPPLTHAHCTPPPGPQLGSHLSRAEQRQLLHRRDYVLHYFDGLVASQGYAATVRE